LRLPAAADFKGIHGNSKEFKPKYVPQPVCKYRF
jgi:hypothetical protein